MEDRAASPSSTSSVGEGGETPKWKLNPYANERSSSPVSTSYSPISSAGGPSRPFTAQKEEVQWPQRNPHFRAVSEVSMFANSVQRQVRTAVPTSRLRVTTSAPSPEMEASMARVASPVASFYVEGEYTANLHVTTEEEELVRTVGGKRVEYSRLHVQFLERVRQMQDVGHVYRKMCLEQDWQEYKQLLLHRKEKQEELDSIFREQDEAWRYSITLKMLLKRMVDLKREMMAMVALMRDSRVKTEAQIVETNVKLAEANRAKQVSTEELDDLKVRLREQREHRNKELEFLRSGIEDIKESRLREVRRQEKQQETLARMKSEESQRRMERLRRVKLAEEGFAAGTEVKLEILDEAMLAERILDATGVSDPNLFLVKMLTRDQTHNTLELQKVRAHEAFERLNESLQTLILHKRELQLEGVDETYQKRSTGDIESRLIKSEARFARALRQYHDAVELIAPIRSGLDALCARIGGPSNGRDAERRHSFGVNSSMLMGTWAETPKPLTDDSRQLDETLSRLETVGDRMVKLVESVDPTSVGYLEANSRRASSGRQSGSHTPGVGWRTPKRVDIYTSADSVVRRRSSEEPRRVTRRSDETGKERPPPPRRSSDFADRPPITRSELLLGDRGVKAEKEPRRRNSDFATSTPEEREKERDTRQRKSAEAGGAPSRLSEGDDRFKGLLSPAEGGGGDRDSVTERVIEALVAELSGTTDGGQEVDPAKLRDRSIGDISKRRPHSAVEIHREEPRVERTEEPTRPKTKSLEPQVSIQEPVPDPGKDVLGGETALESGVRRAMRRQMLQQNRASGGSVGIDESRSKKQILPGTRLHYPPPAEKVNMPRYNFRVAPLGEEGPVDPRPIRILGKDHITRAAHGEGFDDSDDLGRQHAEFKQELERLTEELSGEFSDGGPRRGRLKMLLFDGEEDELGFRRDFASVDLVALREKFSKASEPRKGKSHKAFLKRIMNKVKSPERRSRQTNSLLGQLEIPGLNMATGTVLNGALSPPPAVKRRPLHERKAELKGYNVITEKEQKRMLELLSDVRSKPKIKKTSNRPKSPELVRLPTKKR